jgi:ribosomal protein L1
MAKESKRYRALAAKTESVEHSVDESRRVIEELWDTKFDQTVEITCAELTPSRRIH